MHTGRATCLAEQEPICVPTWAVRGSSVCLLTENPAARRAHQSNHGCGPGLDDAEEEKQGAIRVVSRPTPNLILLDINVDPRFR